MRWSVKRTLQRDQIGWYVFHDGKKRYCTKNFNIKLVLRREGSTIITDNIIFPASINFFYDDYKELKPVTMMVEDTRPLEDCCVRCGHNRNDKPIGACPGSWGGAGYFRHLYPKKK